MDSGKFSLQVHILQTKLHIYLSNRAVKANAFCIITCSLAVSIKMNVLLYAPALLIVYLTQLSLFDTVVQLAVCGSLQVRN